MRANAVVRREAKVDVGYEASKFVLKLGMVVCALIGIWGISCLIGGLASNGLGTMLKGFLTAMTGV